MDYSLSSIFFLVGKNRSPNSILIVMELVTLEFYLTFKIVYACDAKNVWTTELN